MAKCKIFLMAFLLCGCALMVRVPEVVLLPEERIFTVPANQEIAVLLDGVPKTMTFPHDMKLVSATTLVRQEEQLNQKVLKAVKASEGKAKKMQVVLYVFMGLAAGLGIFFKAKKWFPKSLKLNAEVK